MNLGKLKELDIRTLWQHEQYDFSEWLARAENIELLNEAIGLTLTDINKEVFVGSYRCDLVAEDETSNTKVIIENQLETTNHDHLGKIITYASGLDADVVVWIVKEAREEHRSAIEWLNNKTTDVSFFLIEIHAYTIGDSMAAPKFEVIGKPNDFSKNSKRINSNVELNKVQAERLNFWTQLNETLLEKNKPFNLRKATTDHWYSVAIGTSEAHISITLVNKDNMIGVEIQIPNNKDLFDELHNNKSYIDQEIGIKLEWHRLDNKKAAKIIHYIPGLNFNNHDNYPELINEVIDKVVKMRNVFRQYINN